MSGNGVFDSVLNTSIRRVAELRNYFRVAASIQPQINGPCLGNYPAHPYPYPLMQYDPLLYQYPILNAQSAYVNSQQNTNSQETSHRFNDSRQNTNSQETSHHFNDSRAKY